MRVVHCKAPLTTVERNLYVYVGRPSPLGNLWTHSSKPTKALYQVESVAKAIECYRYWLNAVVQDYDYVKIEGQLIHLLDGQKRATMAALSSLNEASILGCWCAPNPCHAEIIVRAWHYCKEKGII